MVEMRRRQVRFPCLGMNFRSVGRKRQGSTLAYVPMDPQDTQLSDDERNMAMICHLLVFSGSIIPLGNFIGPLVLWLVKKDESEFVDFHGKECLNFQISLLIYALCCIPLVFVIIGIPLLIAVGIFGIVMAIIACIKAHSGEYYEFPMTIRFLN